MSPGFGRVIICTPSTSSAVTQVVSKADTTTSLASSVNPTRFGQSTSFTATVSVVAPGTTLVAYPSGTVNFFDGSTLIGSGSLTTTPCGTSADFSSYSLWDGGDSSSARFADDSNFKPSTSSAVAQGVMKADTTTAVRTSAIPTGSGQSATFTATVSVVSPGSTAVANPTGTVNFYDGSTTIGSGSLSTDRWGVTRANFSFYNTSAKSHTLTHHKDHVRQLNHHPTPD